MAETGPVERTGFRITISNYQEEELKWEAAHKLLFRRVKKRTHTQREIVMAELDFLKAKNGWEDCKDDLLTRDLAFPSEIVLFLNEFKENVLPMVLLFLIAFTTSLFVMFPDDPGFSSFPLSFLLGLVMMTGEIGFRETFLEERGSPFFELRLIILVLFVLTILIVVMNLFTGLAVGDTGEVLANSEKEKIWLQADYFLALSRMTPCFRSLPYTITEYADKPPQESFHDTQRVSSEVKEQNQMIVELLNYSKQQSLEIRDLKDLVYGMLEMQQYRSRIQENSIK